MGPRFFPSLPLYFITALFLFTPSLCAGDDPLFTNCSRPFNCGIFKNLSFPFWGDTRPLYCGQQGYKLSCNGIDTYPGISINSPEFILLGIDQLAQPQMMTLSRTLPCPTTLNYSLFSPDKTVVNMTLFSSCSESNLSRVRIEPSRRINCTTNGESGASKFSLFLRDNETNLVSCQEKVVGPVPNEALDEFNSGTLNLSGTLMRNFNVQGLTDNDFCERCLRSGGRCGSNRNSPESFACYCRDRRYDIECGGNAMHCTIIFFSITVLILFKLLVN
ncbi:hypothetical protein SLEP1_g33288 [Rubroshorea leprosula]|uniref:non-specific serine/threonine protein kinase n=1 Tax=Rubroshorea leprosula TaxID=152421 RepID=A0AAV5KG65_9ROSI|nr:hypothetical protein SLEP1_g33288 [Rubroshorea leprosula]